MPQPCSPSGRLPSGAEVVLDVLRDEGVRHVIGNPGTTELPLMQRLAAQTDISYVLALHEASAVGIADGFARMSGRPAFVNLHAAAGLGNAVGALTNAAAARIPMVVTAGQQDLRWLHRGPVLAGDLAGLARPTVKWSHQVGTREELGHALRTAFRLAQAPPTGPVFLALPMNLLDEPGPPAPPRSRRPYPAAPGVAAVSALLADARRRPGGIALVYGDEVGRQAPEEGLALAQALAAPVWGSSWPSANTFPQPHPLWRGFLPTDPGAIRRALGGHSLVLGVGSRLFPSYFPYSPAEPLPASLPLVHLAPDHGELGRESPAQHALVGDIRLGLRALLAQLPAGPSRPAPPARPDPTAARTTAAARTTTAPLNADTLPAVLARCLPPGAPLMDESPSLSRGLRAALTLEGANRYHWVPGGLGWAMPCAVGAALATGTPTLCVVGDGSALYSPQALWTAARLRLPVGFVVADNRAYQVLRDNWQVRDASPERMLGLDLAHPPIDFTALSTAFGVPARRAATTTDLASALRAGFASAGPFLIAADLADKDAGPADPAAHTAPARPTTPAG
ncbi:thiamine pyrophosphate-binding protein [Kitasatospora sp. NPDC004272]